MRFIVAVLSVFLLNVLYEAVVDCGFRGGDFRPRYNRVKQDSSSSLKGANRGIKDVLRKTKPKSVVNRLKHVLDDIPKDKVKQGSSNLLNRSDQSMKDVGGKEQPKGLVKNTKQDQNHTKDKVIQDSSNLLNKANQSMNSVVGEAKPKVLVNNTKQDQNDVKDKVIQDSSNLFNKADQSMKDVVGEAKPKVQVNNTKEDQNDVKDKIKQGSSNLLNRSDESMKDVVGKTKPECTVNRLKNVLAGIRKDKVKKGVSNLAPLDPWTLMEKLRQKVSKAFNSFIKMFNKNVLVPVLTRIGDCLHQEAVAESVASWVPVKVSISPYDVCGFSSLKALNNVTSLSEDAKSRTFSVPLVLNDVDARINSLDVTSGFLTLIDNYPIRAHINKTNILGTVRVSRGMGLLGVGLRIFDIKLIVTEFEGVSIKVDIPKNQRSYKMSMFDLVLSAMEQPLKNTVNAKMREIASQIITKYKHN